MTRRNVVVQRCSAAALGSVGLIFPGCKPLQLQFTCSECGDYSCPEGYNLVINPESYRVGGFQLQAKPTCIKPSPSWV